MNRFRSPGPRALAVLAASLLVSLGACAAEAGAPVRPGADAGEVTGWEARAERVEILRDEWGIPHIYAPTDADAVFGMMYAQAEDDFARIERNFLTSLGRRAEAEGEARLWQDLRQRLFIDPVELQAMYGESPSWLQALMDGWADGLNYYLYTHPEVEPLVLDRFEPWMALSFSEGSIGGDIERVNLGRLESFYGADEAERMEMAHAGAPNEGRLARRGSDAPARVAAAARAGPTVDLGLESGLNVPDPHAEPRGSNGIAIAPENTADGSALLLINPHTSFYFRHEAHVVSEEGLNAYGASTWGQFFIYQGFNETAGWMHTSSSVDNIDEFAEEVFERDGTLFYRYGEEEREVEVEEITVRVRQDDGSMADRVFTTYRTHHGPIVRAADGSWIAVGMMEEPMRALVQSYARTKAANLDEYLEVMDAHTNSSNNTLFADAEGNIAYLHSNFVPERDTRFDYARPVDGADPATDWSGIHSIDESPNAINPSTGFAFCSNNWPYSAAGSASPRPGDFPRYMDYGSENARGIHALEILPGRSDFTLDGLVEAAYSTRVPFFDDLIPALVADAGSLPSGDPMAERIAPAIEALAAWDVRWSVESVPTSVAVFWATALPVAMEGMQRPSGVSMTEYMLSAAAREARLSALDAALTRLEEEFGSWETPWGEINRFQRLTGEIDLRYDDDAPSTPVGFTSARWGSLASFGARPREGTNRWYGSSGNSFVAVVEFGDRLRARAVTAGGLSDDPASPHFDDQTERYATGDLREVHFYREDVEAAATRTYRPGER